MTIRSLLEQKLRAMPGYLGDSATQFENAEFTPTDAPYQSVNILLAEPLNSERSGYFQDQGYMQVTLRYPINKGAGDAEAMALAIRAYFFYSLNLAAAGYTVTIVKTPSIGPGAPDGDRYSLPVKIRFIATSAG